MNDPLSSHLDHARRAEALREERLDPERRARLWAALEQSRSPARALRWAWPAGALALAGAAAALVVLARPPEARLLEGRLQTADGHDLQAALHSGQDLEVLEPARVARGAETLSLERGARWRLEDDALVLAHGAVLLRAERRGWQVVTGEAVIDVREAEVRIARTGQSTRVEVRQGVVRIQASGLSAREVHAPEAVIVSPARPTDAADTRSVVPSDPERPPHARVDGANTNTPAASAVAPEAPDDRLAPRTEAHDAPTPPRASKAPPPDPRARPTTPAEAEVTDRAAPTAALDPTRTLADARALLRRDTPRAQSMAEGVVARTPPSALRTSAQLLVADALRLRGERARAERAYAAVVDSAEAGAFLEEALLRQAELLHELSRSDEALALLGSGRAEATSAVLLPERAVLAARIHLAAGRVEAAAGALEARAEAGPLTLQRTRLDVARALGASAPARAARMLRVVMQHAPPALADEARRALPDTAPGDAPRSADP